ncbi:MAG: class I SAM-dependent methyltransferase [Methanomicrobiales archaeon]|nr:class I SAM-dependent methyltransferase [Methanomicrobiales archaeon]
MITTLILPYFRRLLSEVLQRNAGQIMNAKLETVDHETRTLVTSENERYHFGDIDLNEIGLQHVVRSFTVDRIQFIRDVLPRSVQGPVVDLGDTNGIFLRSIGQGGIGVNISDPAVRAIRARGLETLKADIEFLPFRDRSIETVLLFETLEHVPNPIRVLREIGRVCSHSLVLSVPYVKKTIIHGSGYDPARPAPQHHIFEFSVPDFRKILTYTPFVLERDRIATVLGGTGNILDRLVIALWSIFRERDMFCGCFRRFYICHLVLKPKESGDSGVVG